MQPNPFYSGLVPFTDPDIPARLRAEGWTSADRLEILDEYFGTVYYSRFDFDTWQACNPDADFPSHAALRDAIEASVDAAIEAMRVLEQNTPAE